MGRKKRIDREYRCKKCGGRISRGSVYCFPCWVRMNTDLTKKEFEFSLFRPFRYILDDFLDELNSMDNERMYPNLMRVLPRR